MTDLRTEKHKAVPVLHESPRAGESALQVQTLFLGRMIVGQSWPATVVETLASIGSSI